MNSFWVNLYDRAKDRRYGAFFFGALAAFGGLIAAGALLFQAVCAFDLQRYLIPISASFGLLLLAWIVRGIFLMRQRSQERLRFPPLSREEKRKARSKLLNGMKPIKHDVPPPAPESYVKY